jgi:hypothetical protein
MSTLPAGQDYRNQINGFEEDGRLGLKYILLRLETAGLTERDRASLKQLASESCHGKDISKTVAVIQGDKSSSPLALAIADIVSQVTPDRKAACLGAIFGAHGSRFHFDAQHAPNSASAIAGAISGAVAAACAALLETKFQGLTLQEFLIKDV